jgi:hypothetical protein
VRDLAVLFLHLLISAELSPAVFVEAPMKPGPKGRSYSSENVMIP